MKYTIENYKCPADSPMFPGETFYRIMDIDTMQFGYGMYTTYEAAKEMLDRKQNVI